MKYPLDMIFCDHLFLKLYLLFEVLLLLLDILEFLLSRDHAFVSANYYLENGHVERRAKLLRAGHNVGESRKNLANMAGLGYRHKAALNRYQKQDDMAE